MDTPAPTKLAEREIEARPGGPRGATTSPRDQRDSRESEPTSTELWEQVGFHRPLAGFWWHFGFTILHIIGGISVAAFLYPLMFPFPEIDGYYRTGTNLFIAVFAAFDLGTAGMMNRFIGETGIKDPARMVQYLQFFVWYQMITGLVQVTGIAVWALFLPAGEVVYLTWIYLLYSITQYPAMQNVFRSALSAMQHFDKSQLLGFIQGDIIQKFLEVAFVLLFRYTLGQDPTYGAILAPAIGLVLGKYLDDFLAMAIGMHFFNQALAKQGLSARVCFRHDFDRALVKETVSFGVRTGLPGTLGSFVGMAVLVWWLTVPQYTTFVALFGLAASIVNFVDSMTLDLGGAISESYLNGKRALCQYYVGQTFRFDGFIQLLLYGIIFNVSLVLEYVLVGIGLGYYLLALPFLFPIMLRRFSNPYERLGNAVLTGTHHPTVILVMDLATMAINALVWWLLLVYWRLPQTYGLSAIIWIMPMGDVVALAFRMVVMWTFIHRRVVPLKVPLWQAFGAPGIGAAALGLAGVALVRVVFDPLYASAGLFVALVPSVLLVVILLPVCVYIPVTAFLGAWDDSSVETFRKAARMAGFAKVLVVPMYKSLRWAISHARLHNRFALDDAGALAQALELMALKTRQGSDGGARS